jgi:cytosine/adenosine deaminase-related metal-dependent hydrolase
VTQLHVAPVVLPIAGPPIRDGAVAVEGDRVAWVGRRPEWTDPADVIQWPGVLLPGLVNAHCHLQYTSYADKCQPGVDFLAWIAEFVGRNAEMTDAAWRQSTVDGVAALLATGTTAVADVTAKAVVVDVLAEWGLAGISYVEAVGSDLARWPERREALLAIVDRPSPRAVGVSPHSVYTLASSVARDCVALARHRRLRLHPHAAESPYEVEYVARGSGPFADANRRWGFEMELLTSGGAARSPIAELVALGALGPDSHIAHGVHADAADRAALRETGTAVALCPRSNAVLGVGEAPVAAYRAEGNLIAVGTDSLASAPSLDLLADVALLRDIALRQGSPEAGLDRWLIEAATRGGATALGQSDIGVLRPGTRADLAGFDVPTGVDDDPYRSLVEYGAGRCAGTVLAGRLLPDDPTARPDTGRAAVSGYE